MIRKNTSKYFYKTEKRSQFFNFYHSKILLFNSQTEIIYEIQNFCTNLYILQSVDQNKQ